MSNRAGVLIFICLLMAGQPKVDKHRHFVYMCVSLSQLVLSLGEEARRGLWTVSAPATPRRGKTHGPRQRTRYRGSSPPAPASPSSDCSERRLL